MKSNIKLPEIVIKDYDFNIFCARYNELSEIVSEMKNIIGCDFKNYLVNVTVKDYKIGEKTCKDVRYHFDGDYYKDNEYCVWCKGNNRTVFPTEKTNLSNVPENRFEQNAFLEKVLKNVPSKEIEDQTFVKYTSQDPHKGVICREPGNRIFIRLMGTNYIKASNYAKRN